MKFRKYKPNKISNNIWQIDKQEKMRVPARFFATEAMLPQIYRDNALSQVINVATLPGIQKYSLAMPDIHYGYGFPIGGVAAFDLDEGIISPGGVGYDINCGVRFCRTNLRYEEVKEKIRDIVRGFIDYVPSGVGSHGAIKRLNFSEIDKVVTKGAEWAIESGFGDSRDLSATESFGKMEDASPDKISPRAKKRGLNQVGTLGSGNHFVEIGVIDKVYDQRTAAEFQLEKNQIVVIVHSGSRGLGYQVCDDYLHKMVREIKNYPFVIVDKQLCCAPFKSNLGSDYFQAMSCAANYAWANRQVLMTLAKRSIQKTLAISPKELGFTLIYDVCHNIAKVETHNIDGKNKKVCVHRKGATRSFGSGREELSHKFRQIGQPVIVPGDMGTNSFLMIGKTKALKETFGSCCHGAGRVMSRSAAKRKFNFGQIKNKLQNKGISVFSVKKSTLVEEAPATYKNVTQVVDAVEGAGLAKKVVRTRPLGVLKG